MTLIALTLWAIGALDAYMTATHTILAFTRLQVALRVVFWFAFTLVWAIESWLK